MDFWKKLDELKEAEGLRTDADLARSIILPGKLEGLTQGYFWNVRNGAHRPGKAVVENLAERMLKRGILSGRIELLEFKEASGNLPLGGQT